VQPDEDLIQDIINRIIDAVQPEQIILFGSAARGEMGRNSDIDLLVIKSGVHRRQAIGKIYRHMIGAGYPVDVIVAHPEDIERYGDSPALVYREALSRGRVVYAE
jgi:uncharacterized protein